MTVNATDMPGQAAPVLQMHFRRTNDMIRVLWVFGWQKECGVVVSVVHVSFLLLSSITAVAILSPAIVHVAVYYKLLSLCVLRAPRLLAPNK